MSGHATGQPQQRRRQRDGEPARTDGTRCRMVSSVRSFLSSSSSALVSGALALSVLSACGGAVALDDIPREVDGGAGPGNGAGNGNGAGSGTGNGVGTGGSGSAGGSGSTSPGSPGSPPFPPDASPPPKPTVIACGQSSCSGGTQSCCITQAGDASCIAKGGQCAGIPLDCTSGASCPGGQVCCLDIQGLPTAACTSLAACDSGPSPNGPPSSVILCDSDAECPQAMRCRDAPGDVGIKFCRPRRNGGGGNGGNGGNGGGGGGGGH